MSKFLKVFILALLATPIPQAFSKPAADFYFEGYEPVKLSYVREYYDKIEDGRRIRVEGWFKSYEWHKLYEYQQKLKGVGLNHKEFQVVKLALREDGPQDVRYSFPVLLCRAAKGDTSELKNMKVGQKLAVYGTFFNLRDSDWALVVDVVEAIDRGGFEKYLISDYRVPSTPTPTATPTPTPGLGLFTVLMNKINPKESPTPTGTWNPEATPAAVPAFTASPTPSPSVKKAAPKKSLHKKKAGKKIGRKAARKPKAKPLPSPVN
jgi:hypothetical protein